MADAIILTMGESIPLVKTFVYLTPSGISSLIGHFSNQSYSSAEIDKQKVALVEAMGNKKYAKVQSAFPSENVSETGLFPMDYSKTLFLMMLLMTSRDKMLRRLTDIIEFEAVENTKGGSFNLDYSYTYIRASGQFSTNMFIPINEKKQVGVQERIIYRGY